MGCDIHVTVERHVIRDFEAEVMHLDYVPRSYTMFGCMVDGHGRAPSGVVGVAPARGLPPGPTKIAMDWAIRVGEDPYGEGARGGAHTFSWLTPAEYREALDRYRSFVGEEPAPEWLALGCYLDELEKHGDVRLVFSFDN